MASSSITLYMYMYIKDVGIWDSPRSHITLLMYMDAEQQKDKLKEKMEQGLKNLDWGY